MISTRARSSPSINVRPRAFIQATAEYGWFFRHSRNIDDRFDEGLWNWSLAVGLCAISLAGSVVLSATANGIAVFMVFGAGLVAGLFAEGRVSSTVQSSSEMNASSLNSISSEPAPPILVRRASEVVALSSFSSVSSFARRSRRPFAASSASGTRASE